MKNLITLPPVAAVAALLLSMPVSAEPKPAKQDRQSNVKREPVDWVDCMTGTASSRWMLYPGASMPFGMVKLSPDNQGNRTAKGTHKAGYEYTIENIMGFSHVHSWTMSGLLTMPVTGPLQTQPGTEKDPDGGYRSRFRHDTETAEPGYYAVTLDDYGIRAELTCTTRTGLQRYTFPESDQARILFDLLFPSEYGKTLHDAKVTKVSDTEIAGYAKMSSGLHFRGVHYQDYKLHFVTRTSKPFDSMDGWNGDKVSLNIREISGKGDTGVSLNFKTAKGEQIMLQTGISLVSIDQARLNLDVETKSLGWKFDAYRLAARKTWNKLLGRVMVEGGREVDYVKFYTNLYRSYCARTIWSDVNGKYIDMYEKEQQLDDPNSPVYGSDALWNTFWNLNQLWNLLTPDVSEKWVRSLLEIYDVGGWLPRGPTGIEYSGIMESSHAIPLIVAAYQHGIRGFDVEKAFEAMLHSQTVPGRNHPGGGEVGNQHLDLYLKHQYMPAGKHKHERYSSNTLEYAYDDWCLSQMAKTLGKDKKYAEFSKRSEYWRNLFDQETGFMRARREDGSWLEEPDPYSRRGGWAEGNPWQYTWFVPQNVPGLIELMGRERFIKRLNKGLADSAEGNFNAPVIHRPTIPINHGNQPNMHVTYLFNHTGTPWLTQKWTRAIMEQYYGHTPFDGWPGDEDQGQGGAWFVMSALGLFQTDGGCRVDPIYEIGSPLFERAVIRLDPNYYSGKEFVIEARNNGPRNIYIQSATLNGKPLNKPWFPAKEALNGGHLLLEMGPEPNQKWGNRPEQAPPKP
jgi:predicted alpha-1,2-mannosidase